MAEPWAVNPLVPVRLRPVTPKRMGIDPGKALPIRDPRFAGYRSRRGADGPAMGTEGSAQALRSAMHVRR